MNNGKRPPGSMHGGTRVTRTVDGKKEEAVTQYERRLDLSHGAENMASVGVSVSAGMSTEYAREKFEVTAWCTLPSLPDQESMELSYNAAYEYAAGEVKSRLDDIAERFFPGMMGGNQ